MPADNFSAGILGVVNVTSTTVEVGAIENAQSQQERNNQRGHEDMPMTEYGLPE